MKKEFKSQKTAEKYYREQGWDIIQPKLTKDRSKCKHQWQKIKENDYQCIKCNQGYLSSNPPKNYGVKL